MKYALYGMTLLVLALAGAFVYEYRTLQNTRAEYAQIEAELHDAREGFKGTLTAKDAEIGSLGTKIMELEQKYALSEENGTELLRMLNEEKSRNEDFEDQIKDISGTVGKLDKLSKIDAELLQKYSKVYFLNEHYMPERLSEIPSEFRFKTDEPEYIHAQVAPFLTDLLEDAKEDGIELLIVSAFRSFDEQKALKGVYTVQYGSGANTFSADQGYSEHQLGTTIDFTTKDTGGGLVGFDKTEAYTWLTENAYKYGFVLSYPERNGYYIFEPWHWRFVGEDLADDLHDNNQYFYDLDQRGIDTYLISLFD